MLLPDLAASSVELGVVKVAAQRPHHKGLARSGANSGRTGKGALKVWPEDTGPYVAASSAHSPSDATRVLWLPAALPHGRSPPSSSA